jgi:serine/threonine-protein kinase
MTNPLLERRVPSRVTRLIGARGDTWTGSPFVQARLALLGKTVFLLAGSFFVVVNGMLVAGGGLAVLPRLVTQANVMHFVAASVMGTLWLVASVRSWSLKALAILDAGSLFLAGTSLALMAAQNDEKQLIAGLFALSVTIMARAVLIPSTATRTFALSWMAAAPLVIVSVVFHQPALVPGFSPGFLKALTTVSALLWLTISTTLSTVTSRTIYGLRQQISKASEIGQYTLEEKIGSGGMGEVWRATHRMLIRPAAVKLITAPALGSTPSRDPEIRLRRFEREARATGGLKSPHTVQLYDFGVTDDGTLYYVMELLDGMDLDTLVERFGPLPPERAVHMLLQTCASLEEAHLNGLIHRDIKPANLVVSRVSSEWDFVKVLDFGLVKLESTAPSEASVRISAESNVSGTPGFIAPEIVLGAESDHRVDIYALGCVAYWLVTGELVFEGPGAIKVLSDHVHTQPAPPSSRTEQAIARELDALILQCLEKDPGKRPASATELRSRLRALKLAPAWTAERAEAWWLEHAPNRASMRPVADVLLSQEAHPARVIRRARN